MLENLPVKCELALSSEEVDMILELEFEDVVFANIVIGGRNINVITKKRKTGERKVVLEGFVEVETKVGEHNPQLLPAIAVLELPQQVS